WPKARAEYRMTEKQPVFSTNLAAEQWALVRLKPGKNDRNLPMSKNSGWGWAGSTFRQGPDPKYRVQLTGEAGANGTQMKPTEPLAPGEYGFVAIVRGQPKFVEVIDFGVDCTREIQRPSRAGPGFLVLGAQAPPSPGRR